ncbi:SGNH/GDSL hydrolase family protein [Salinispora mooreana]|uniref:SGNH/GDSL hydrolase family protein n=1 Tax=Salinispora mooreana TaxID=999545 RepID=UPI00035DB4A4|nr:SGNH/GDSL hydrolase family protein [Salinispora mooreana]
MAGAAALLMLGTPSVVATADPSAEVSRHRKTTWAASWATAVAGGNASGPTNAGFENQTIRNIVHTTVGGSVLRVRLSNMYGEQDIQVGRATIARPDETTPDDLSDIDPSTLRKLTFGGSTSATMNQGAELISDPVDFPIGDQQDLVVTVYYPAPTGLVTFHGMSRQTSFIGDGDLASDAGAGLGRLSDCCWLFLSGIDVQRHKSPGSVVVFGDSIAEGSGSTLNANKRWPDLLADRYIDARPDSRTPAVLNMSLAGNRLNHEGTEPGAGGFPGYNELGPNALARLDEDIFAQNGARAVITHLGINDIWMSDDSAEAIITSLRQVNQQVKARGLRSLVGTLTPYEGHGEPGVWTPEKEATRQAVNEYLRTSKEFDGVVDFDRVLRDPEQPSRLLPAYDSGDHLHPNDAGSEAMAGAVSLRLLGL